MAGIIELTNHEWSLVEDLFDPTGRRGIPARYPRRSMVGAILFLARTGIQWRYLLDHYPPWAAVWQQWRRWRANGVWARAMSRITRLIRSRRRPHVEPTMVMIDAQTVRGGRAGPTFHSAGGRGGRTIGTKRSILIEILGLPLAVRVDPAKPHDVRVGRKLIADHLAELPDVRAIVADRGYRGLANLAACKHLSLDIKAPPKGTTGFTRTRAALSGRARLRAPGPLAAAVAWLRGHRGEREGVARGRLPRLFVRAAASRADLITRLVAGGARSGWPTRIPTSGSEQRQEHETDERGKAPGTRGTRCIWL